MMHKKYTNGEPLSSEDMNSLQLTLASLVKMVSDADEITTIDKYMPLDNISADFLNKLQDRIIGAQKKIINANYQLECLIEGGIDNIIEKNPKYEISDEVIPGKTIMRKTEFHSKDILNADFINYLFKNVTSYFNDASITKYILDTLIDTGIEELIDVSDDDIRKILGI